MFILEKDGPTIILFLILSDSDSGFLRFFLWQYYAYCAHPIALPASPGDGGICKFSNGPSFRIL